MYNGDAAASPVIGIQYLIFKSDGNGGLTNKYVGSLSNFGQMGRAQICYFAGLVTCAVANAFITLTIADSA